MNASGWAITILFFTAIVCVSFLKFYDHNLDATFIGVMTGMVMGMAGFVSLHFNQKQLELKVDEAKHVAEDNVKVVAETAKELKEANNSVIAKQTELLVNVIADKKEEIVNEIKTSSS